MKYNDRYIEVSSLLLAGEGNHLDGYMDIQSDFLKDEGINPLSDINLKYKITKSKKILYINISIDVKVLINCVRCLKEKEIDISLSDIDAEFGIVKGDCEFEVLNSKYIDLTELIREVLILELDGYVCEDSCLGLCLFCGIDKSIEKCNCKKNENKNIFARFFEEDISS